MTKIEMKPVGLFATPESMEDLQSWLEKANDPYVTTASMMMYNFLVSKFDMYEKKGDPLGSIKDFYKTKSITE